MTKPLELQYPFTTSSGRLISELKLTRLKVKNMRAAQRISSKPEDWDESLMAAMTGLVPEDLEEMDLADYQALQKRFQSMLGLGKQAEATVADDGATGEMVPVSTE